MQTADTPHVYYDPLWREGIMADNIKAAFRLSMPLPSMEFFLYYDSVRDEYRMACVDLWSDTFAVYGSVITRDLSELIFILENRPANFPNRIILNMPE